MLSIRRAGSADAIQLAEVGEAAFRAAYTSSNALDDLESHLQKHFTEDAIIKEISAGKSYDLASLGDECAGFCKHSISAPDSKTGSGRSLHIEQLYVAPGVQGGGVGRQLVDHVYALALETGLDGLRLGVWEAADWAIGFYQACGFQAVGEEEFWIGNNRQRDLLMYRKCLREGEQE